MPRAMYLSHPGSLTAAAGCWLCSHSVAGGGGAAASQTGNSSRKTFLKLADNEIVSLENALPFLSTTIRTLIKHRNHLLCTLLELLVIRTLLK